MAHRPRLKNESTCLAHIGTSNGLPLGTIFQLLPTNKVNHATDYPKRILGRVAGYEEGMPAETPFADPQLQRMPLFESYSGETVSSEWEFSSPFVRGESMHSGDSQPVPFEVSRSAKCFRS